MKTYIAFLHAINVAGHGIVKMDALCAAFKAAGCWNVRSYIQSGNIIFDLPPRSEAAILGRLRVELRRLLGREPAIFLRTLEEIVQIVVRDYFRDFQAESAVKLYVVFLSELTRVKPQFPMLLPKDGLELIGIAGREVLVVSRPNKDGFYAFPNISSEKKWRVSVTSRSWNTIAKIVKFAQSQ